MGRLRRHAVELPPPRDETPFERFFHDRGERAPHERVMRDGVDITDTHPPSEWPWPMSMYYECGWRPWRSIDDPGTSYLPRES